MVLAWPTPGNSYQHWVFYVCDFEKGIVRLEETKHDFNPLSLAFHYDWHYYRENSLDRLKTLAIPESRPFGRRLITNGRVSGHYLNRFLDWDSNSQITIDIRFEPVVLDYLTGAVIRKPIKNNPVFDQYNELWKTAKSTLKKFADDSRPKNDSYQITGGLNRLAACIEFNKIFNAMEPSQFKVEIDRQSWRFKKPSSLSGFILHHLKTHAHYDMETFDQLMKALCLDTVTELRPIKKCLERRIRRYPTASKGTVNLLKMINASRSILSFTKKVRSA
jgi:hypothetical protein